MLTVFVVLLEKLRCSCHNSFISEEYYTYFGYSVLCKSLNLKTRRVIVFPEERGDMYIVNILEYSLNCQWRKRKEPINGEAHCAFSVA